VNGFVTGISAAAFLNIDLQSACMFVCHSLAYCILLLGLYSFI